MKDLFLHPEKYNKFWVALAGFGLSLASIYFPEAPWLPPLTSFLTAIGVVTVPNKK